MGLLIKLTPKTQNKIYSFKMCVQINSKDDWYASKWNEEFVNHIDMDDLTVAPIYLFKKFLFVIKKSDF